MNDNATSNKIEQDLYTSDFDIDELEKNLESSLEEDLADLDFLEEDKNKIGNPDTLGKAVMDVVWEQVINQIGLVAGEDFIKENRGLKLDLSKDAHIQTTENFAEGKIADHNTEIDYTQRYADWRNNFQKNEDGNTKTKIDYRTGEEKEVLRVKNTKKDPNGENYNYNYNAREFIDKDRPQGSKIVQKDHTISAAEIIRDPEAAAHLTRDEQANFANSEKNLVDLDAAANQSKSDSKMEDWLDSERDGKKPAERFNIDENELREREKIAREEYEKEKREGEKRSIESGKKSRKQEANRIGKKALRSVVMGMLAELLRNIIGKLIAWFKSSERKLKTLLESIKEAISKFLHNVEKNLLTAGKTLTSTVATAIMGPIFSTVQKIWQLLKQGAKSIKEAIDYIKNPANRKKSFGIIMLEIGKIVMTGLTAAGALVLGDLIEKGLMTIPVFAAIQIPLLGSLANIVGIFLGAVVAGIIGAIILNKIDQLIAKKKKAQITCDQIDKANEILKKQAIKQEIDKYRLNETKIKVANDLKSRHDEAKGIIRESVNNIINNRSKDNDEDFDLLDAQLNELLEEN